MSKQRPIEFRVWDIQQNKFVKNLDDFAIDCNGIVLRFYSQDKSSEAYIIEGNFFGGEENYIAQQFTGLFDKNGKKIFEGDILEIIVDEKSYTDTVVHIDGAFGTQARLVFTPFCKTPEYMAICVVVGNIFENPDLLQQQGK